MKKAVLDLLRRPTMNLLLILAASVTPGGSLNRLRGQVISIIPRPVSVTLTGGAFIIEEGTLLYCNPARTELRRLAVMFRDEIEKFAGLEMEIGTGRRGKNGILLELNRNSGPSAESYRIRINTNGIRISAPAPHGIFNGLKSLEQMILCSDQGKDEILVACVEITDYPRYEWRGMHLDVSRHFFTADSIKRYIDFLALYKFNRFHWHLTDDQGWRIEIKKYPELTLKGAWRNTTDSAGVSDSVRWYGGYYTQEEIREVIRYAYDRYVTVVPEIEMPGHSQAVLAAYPELGVTGNKVEVKTNWGISPNIYSPFKGTFDFLEGVLEEVMELFPSEYIHIGGDEVIKDQWKASTEVQDRIRNLDLKDEDELQGWFLKKIDSLLSQNGRRLIGWDEILEGGLPPDAIVMSWRGMEGGIRAAGLGHEVIMCPNTHCYLNFAQAENEPTTWNKRKITKLEKVYDFEPCPPELNENYQGHIIGGQGCIWTEHIETFRGLENKLFPRINALSEVLWSPGERDINEFMIRLKAQRILFHKLNINYYKGDLDHK
jgi:hexosaminidase